MSITFDLTRFDADHDAFVPACTVNHGECTVVEHLLDEDIVAYSMPGWCVECSETNRDACPVCTMSLNVSNASAAMILERLGLEFDYCGTIDPVDLMGRALVANVGRDDSGMPESIDAGEGRATMIDCAVPAGYFEARFGALADLAQAAIDHGCLIGWG